MTETGSQETSTHEERSPRMGLDTLRRYRRAWLRSDLVAGVTVAALLVPEGMAYAQIAGVPPETAFYAAPAGLVAYALLGTSRQLVVAVSAAVAATSASIVGEMAGGGTEEFVALTAGLALVAGLVMMIAGALKMGRVSEFFSESVLKGFVFGLAIVIAIRQLPKILGIEGEEGNAFERLAHIVSELGETHTRTLIVGLTSLAVMLAVEHLVPRLPAALVTLVYGIVLSSLLGLDDDGVHVVGEIPAGLAAPRIPDVSRDMIDNLVLGGVGLAVLIFAEAIGPARQFADRHGYEIAPDRELIGTGAANAAAGLFRGFPIGASLSKSAANDGAGARSSMSLIVAAALTALVALFLTPLFESLPEATLGAIVIVAVSGMMDVAALRRLYRLRRADLALSLVALGAVLVVETLAALLIAVFVSLVLVLARVSAPRVSRLGRQAGHPGWLDVARHPEAEQVPGVMVVRPEAELFFANVARVGRDIVAAVDDEPERQVLVVDLEMTGELDAPAAEGLRDVCESLIDRGVSVHLARVHGAVYDMLERAGVTEVLPAERIHPTVGRGIGQYVRVHPELAPSAAELLDAIVVLVEALDRTSPTDPTRTELRGELAARLEQLERSIDGSGSASDGPVR